MKRKSGIIQSAFQFLLEKRAKSGWFQQKGGAGVLLTGF